MTRRVEFWVDGLPAPKGSKNLGRTKAGAAYMYEQSSPTLAPWMKAVKAEAKLHRTTWGEFTPVMVRIAFVFRAPARVRDAVAWKETSPDIDKLERAVLDALKGTVIHDDARICGIFTTKAWSHDHPTGARILVQDAPVIEFGSNPTDLPFD